MLTAYINLGDRFLFRKFYFLIYIWKGLEEKDLKKIAIRILLTILLTSVVTLAFNIQPAKASGTIYIRADGSVEGTDKIVTADNVTYTFTGNIIMSGANGIVIERDNILLDFPGLTWVK